ncbi:MAG: thioredoxin TrxC [Sphingomonas sp.]
MTDTNAETSTDSLVITCPVDGALNRVPRARLREKPQCGTCHNPLFQGKPVNLTAASFDRHALQSDLPVVIDFWAVWCSPCTMMSPRFEQAAALLEPRVRMAKIDIDAESAIAERYGIRSIPSMIMIHKGREIARTTGAMQTADIVKWIEQALAKT